MAFIRSFLFWIFLYLSVAILVLSYFPIAFFVKKKTLADDCAKAWSQTVLFLLRFFLKIDHQILGTHNLPQTPCIIACKHHSMWETVVFHLLCKHPAYIYKKELAKVPLYGWYVQQMSGVRVDRGGGASALKDLIRQTKFFLHAGHNVIIFPQGTRIPPNATTGDYPYQIGIAALYLACNVPVVPVALNSGNFWRKSLLIKKQGRITLEFMEPIMPGLTKAEFMAQLEERVEKGSAKLRETV